MIVIVQSDRFNNLIRRLEARPDLHDDELSLKFRQFTDRLWEQTAAYGARFAGLIGTSLSLASLRFNLIGRDPETVLAGISLLEPVSIEIEPDDIDALVANKLARGYMKQNFQAIRPELVNIELPGLQDKLESLCSRLLNGAIVSSAPQEFDPVDDETKFRLYCIENGLPIPGQQRINRQIIEDRQTREFQERERAKVEERFAEHERNNENDSSWGVRDL